MAKAAEVGADDESRLPDPFFARNRLRVQPEFGVQPGPCIKSMLCRPSPPLLPLLHPAKRLEEPVVAPDLRVAARRLFMVVPAPVMKRRISVTGDTTTPGQVVRLLPRGGRPAIAPHPIDRHRLTSGDVSDQAGAPFRRDAEVMKRVHFHPESLPHPLFEHRFKHDSIIMTYTFRMLDSHLFRPILISS